MNVPGGLVVAAVLQWVAAAIALIYGLTLIVTGISMGGSEAEAQVEATLIAQGITQVSGSTVTAGVLLAGFVLLMVALARIIVSWFLLRGREWARIVIALLVLFSLLSGVAYLFNDEIIRGVVTIVIEAVVLVLLFSASSSEYIRHAAARRAEPVG